MVRQGYLRRHGQLRAADQADIGAPMEQGVKEVRRADNRSAGACPDGDVGYIVVGFGAPLRLPGRSPE
jgi:hypothetical protein